jgi:hypothetical protein
MPPSFYETIAVFKNQGRHYTHFSSRRRNQLYTNQKLAASGSGKMRSKCENQGAS